MGEISNKNVAVCRNYRTCPITDYFNSSLSAIFKPGIFYFQVQVSFTPDIQVFRDGFENFNVYLGLDFYCDRDSLIHLLVIILEYISSILI